MTNPVAIRAVFADWKLVKTRSTVQLVFEIPIEESDAAYDVLGGMPQPSQERWFGIAAIKEAVPALPPPEAPEPVTQPRPARDRREWRGMPPSTQAAIRGDEPAFIEFLKAERPDDWHEAASDPAECVRLICGVGSRRDLDRTHSIAERAKWFQLDDAYQAWLRIGA
jgi:hypothetical protein